MRTIALTAGLALALGSSTAALAWGEAGHELVGSIAQSILEQPGHSKARQKVQTILNKVGHHTLSDASTWADCVRSVQKSGDKFEVRYVTGKTPKICTEAFPENNTAETDLMVAYVKSNWSQCDYDESKPGSGNCHATFHFEDIPIQHGRYSDGDLSTSKHDIVSTIGEAIYYLKNGHGSPGAVVKFADSREALFVLAHMVGDLHQPLHVGSVYLDSDGRLVDPGNDKEQAKETFTKGGNNIFDGASHAAKPPELHADWDGIPANWGVSATPEIIAAAQEVEVDTGDYKEWPAKWATETILVARNDAFKGLTFDGNGPGNWKFHAGTNYAAHRRDIQKQQIERAGARLARLLAAIWPE